MENCSNVLLLRILGALASLIPFEWDCDKNRKGARETTVVLALPVGPVARFVWSN